ncbi:hypothetical protein BD413DRAFT_492042 [Trametes elegans]|nr:hypothetical protein BD413DRAFT_492042 [Trametes elegans]
MSADGYNIWGVVSGIIGTIAVMIPLIIACCCVRRPSTLYPPLSALLKETQGLLDTAYREGLTENEAELLELQVNIWKSSTKVEQLCAAIHARDNLWNDLKNWCKGLSGEISIAYEALNSHRVKLANRNSYLRRKKMESEAFLARMAIHDGKKSILPDPPRLGVTTEPAIPPGIADDYGVSDVNGSYPSLSPAIQPSTLDTASADGEDRALAVASSGHASDSTLPQVQTASKVDAVDRPTHRLLSDADIQRLLSIALDSPRLRQESRERRKQTRRRQRIVLIGFGKELCGGGGLTPSGRELGEDSMGCAYVTNSRLKDVLNILRGMPGAARPQEGSAEPQEGSVRSQEGSAQGGHHYAHSLLEAEIGSTGDTDEEGWSDEDD